ncbi:hypothetical protein BJ741DRAFT_588141 [Chytriomyces cf. hyalinus JEL632]|nr:hypothetical protein BJ741DRAFT_588141 [Chytriomyces cf. hyalinus JEL632]
MNASLCNESNSTRFPTQEVKAASSLVTAQLSSTYTIGPPFFSKEIINSRNVGRRRRLCSEWDEWAKNFITDSGVISPQRDFHVEIIAPVAESPAMELRLAQSDNTRSSRVMFCDEVTVASYGVTGEGGFDVTTTSLDGVRSKARVLRWKLKSLDWEVRQRRIALAKQQLQLMRQSVSPPSPPCEREPEVAATSGPVPFDRTQMSTMHRTYTAEEWDIILLRELKTSVYERVWNWGVQVFSCFGSMTEPDDDETVELTRNNARRKSYGSTENFTCRFRA